MNLRFFACFFACGLILSVPTAALSTLPDEGSATDYISLWKAEAIYQMVVHRIPASITLAQGMLESGNGSSRLAREGNNHFGIKCHSDWGGKKIYEDDEQEGECFRKYRDACESFEDHSQFLKRTRYEKLFVYDTDDYKRWARGLKECGYATNPDYPRLLTDLIERHRLDEYDRQGMALLKKGEVPPRVCSEEDEEEVAAEREKERAPKEKHKPRREESETPQVTLAPSHELRTSANRIRYVVAAEGDTQESVAEDLDVMPWQIRRYNDLSAGDVLTPGEVVYLQPKRNRGSAPSHRVADGDTWRSISQQYGIKIPRLLRLNGQDGLTPPSTGKELRLR
jgi:LysM repeat protein